MMIKIKVLDFFKDFFLFKKNNMANYGFVIKKLNNKVLKLL